MKRLGPACILIPLVVVTMILALVTLRDVRIRQETESQILAGPVWQSTPPEDLFKTEIVSDFQDGETAVAVICRRSGELMQTGADTLYLRADNTARSAAYFPVTNSAREVWTYAAFDNTSTEDLENVQMEYGTPETGWLETDIPQQSWQVTWTRKGDQIEGRLPTDAFLSPGQNELNILFEQGGTVVFADVLNEEIEIGSPIRFSYELPFQIPDFDTIRVVTV